MEITSVENITEDKAQELDLSENGPSVIPLEAEEALPAVNLSQCRASFYTHICCTQRSDSHTAW